MTGRTPESSDGQLEWSQQCLVESEPDVLWPEQEDLDDARGGSHWFFYVQLLLEIIALIVVFAYLMPGVIPGSP